MPTLRHFSVVSLTIVTALFVSTNGARADEQKPAEEGRQRAGGGGNNPLVMFQKMEQAGGKLELNAEQKTRFDALMAETKKQIDPIMEKARGGDKEARQVIQKTMQGLPLKLIDTIGTEQAEKLQKLAGAGGGDASPGRTRGGAQARNQEPSSKQLASKVDLATLIPIPELGSTAYKGFEGGYYSNGKNERPADHEAAGVALAKKIRPLDADGKASPEGKIGLLTIGMSNTTMESQVFIKLATADPAKNPKVVVIDGALGGQTAFKIQNPNDNGGTGEKYWQNVDSRLKSANISRAQVQAIWLKEADAHPTDPFPKHAQTFEKEMENVVRVIHERFPNARQVFVSNRTFGGYATSPLNPEPYAYETGFGVKWLIEKQIKGDPELNFDPAKGTVKAPWMSWGPDLWTNGTTPRKSDGFTYTMDDVIPADRTHPTDAGRDKVAKLLLNFFKTDATAKGWFAGK